MIFQKLQTLTFAPRIEGKSSWNSLLANADKSTSVIFVHKALHLALYHLWFQNKFESYYMMILEMLHCKTYSTNTKKLHPNAFVSEDFTFQQYDLNWT